MILDNLNAISKKFNIKIRFVEINDAQKIIELRTNEKLSRFLHKTSNDIEQQISYIKKYKQKELQGVEYYLAFTDINDKTLGFYRLYSIDYEKSCFTIGSWVFDPELEDNSAVLADVLSKMFGFDELKLNNCYFEVNKQNKKVMKYHNLFSPTFLYEDNELNNFFLLSKSEFSKNVDGILNLIS